MTTSAAVRDRRLAVGSPAVGVVLGLAIMAAAWTPWAVQVVVVLTQLLVLVGLHRGLQVSAPLSGMAVAALATAVADVAVNRAAPPRTLEPLITVVALSVLAAIAAQLARRDGRAGLLLSLSTTVVASALGIAAAAWIVLALNGDHHKVRIAGIALVVASALRLIPSDRWAPWCVLLGAIAAGAVGAELVDSVAKHGALFGLAVGVAVALTDAVVRRGTLALRERWWTTGAVAVAAAGPLVYLTVQVVT